MITIDLHDDDNDMVRKFRIGPPTIIRVYAVVMAPQEEVVLPHFFGVRVLPKYVLSSGARTELK